MSDSYNLILNAEFNLEALNGQGISSIATNFDIDTMPLRIVFSSKNGVPHFNIGVLSYDQESLNGAQELAEGTTIRDIVIPKVTASDRHLQVQIDRKEHRVVMAIGELKAA